MKTSEIIEQMSLARPANQAAAAKRETAPSTLNRDDTLAQMAASRASTLARAEAAARQPSITYESEPTFNPEPQIGID